MQQNNISHTDDITLEVRKAYRLLFDYQNHILKLMKFVCASYRAKYLGGYPKFCNSAPRKGSGSLDNWAWDWLNMYFYEFHFKGDSLFSVILINDTGYYQRRDESKTENDKNRLDLSQYDDVELSQTRLVFVSHKGEWKPVDNWQSKDFIFSDEGKEKTIDGKATMVYKSYKLSDFETEERAISSLKNFSSLCKKHGLKELYKDRI